MPVRMEVRLMKAKLNKTIIILGFLLSLGGSSHYAFAEDQYLIPGDARKGWQVFAEKGCIQCHAMGETGRNIIAPDLSKSPAIHLSSGGLAAAMWNHAPEMWEKMYAKWIIFQPLNEAEMSCLLYTSE